MKILIFGTGEFAKNHFEKVTELVNNLTYEIVGFIDNNKTKQGGLFFGKEIYAPEVIPSLSYDKVLILCSDKYRKEIYTQLAKEYKISANRIITIYQLLQEKINKVHKEKSRSIKQGHFPRIYDCFTFFNEIELLMMRLDSLYDYVDYFVIVELNQTHRGVPKEYNFLKYRHFFEKYIDKIIYIQPENVPQYGGDGDYTIENFQRRRIMDGLVHCEMQDVICVSDLDEIPNPKILQMCREDITLDSRNPISLCLDTNILVLQQKFYYYFFNCQNCKDWYGSILTRYGNIDDLQLRDWSIPKLLPHIPEGGWHFSYFGGFERVRNKINSIVGSSVYSPVSDSDILDRIKHGVDPYGRSEVKLQFIEASDMGFPNIKKWIKTYPEFMMDNYSCKD